MGLGSMTDNDRLRRADRAIWGTIGLIGLAVIAATFLTPLRIEWRSFIAPVSCGALIAAAAWFYRSVRDEPRLAAVLTSTAQIIAFAAVGAPLSYLAATAGFPLQDALFDSWDRAWLHLDWTPLMQVIAERPNLRLILMLAYSSFAVQTVTTVFALGVAGHFARLSTFIVAFMATTLITIAFSAVLPAVGPWVFLDLHATMANGFLPTSSTSWPVFLGLRDGTFHTINGMNSEGIITFPSLHAALGILFAAALWRIRGIKWAALVLNALMLVATPAYGSHYFVDVIAGVLLAVLCWIVAARLFGADQAATDDVAAASRSGAGVAAANASIAQA
jgi:membrane-associated phospholipid phosphatase